MQAPHRARMIGAAVAGVVLCCITFVVTLTGFHGDEAGLAAAGRVLMVGVPVAVGCYAWYRRPGEPFGPLLVATGFAWFLTTLAESDGSLLYSIGRVAGWLVELELIYLALSFPSGRLTTRLDRLLFWAGVALVVTLYLPTALIDEAYPLPAPYTSCETGCPPNAFFVLGSEPAAMDDVIQPLREAITIALFLAVTARLAVRVRGATPAMRRVLSPVLVVASARVAMIAISLIARRIDPASLVSEALTWAAAMALPALAASFLLGLVRGRLFVARSLETLGSRMGTGLDPPGLRAALAEALADPSLSLAYRAGDRWVDAGGAEVELPADGSGRCVTQVAAGDRRIAAIVHDEALRDQQDLVDAAASYTRMALDNQRLVAQVESSLREVRESRARILAAADAERRRIERDLHDGAQQRLVALRIKMELTAEQLRADPEAGLERLRALGGEVEDTVEEIRSLARGVYPSLLADQGLGEALRAAAMRSPVPATVEPNGVGRYAEEVESAVYFCCLEALQNASKHAGPAATIGISLSAGEALRFEVRDDGDGFDVAAAGAGAGLVNMRDRLGAVGGELTIESSPGGGAVVAGSVPLDGRVG